MDMKMKANIKNKTKIAALEHLQVNCREPLMEVNEVNELIADVDKRLKDFQVKKKDTVGARLTLINGQGSFSRNYWGQLLSTLITIEGFKSGSFWVDAFRNNANCEQRIGFLNVEMHQPFFRF